MSFVEILHSLTGIEDGQWPDTLVRARKWAERSKWSLLVGCVLLLFLPLRWVFPEWSLRQFWLLLTLAVPPITADQITDVNFWGGQVFSLLIVTTVTWMLLNSRRMWCVRLILVLVAHVAMRSLTRVAGMACASLCCTFPLLGIEMETALLLIPFLPGVRV